MAEEAGAYYASQKWRTPDIYSANSTNVTKPVARLSSRLSIRCFQPGASRSHSKCGSRLAADISHSPAGVTVVAKDGSNNPTIVREVYGSGALIPTLMLERCGDTTLDWTIWDNWAMGGVHTNSVGVWQMLGRMIGWAYNGDPSQPVVNPRLRFPQASRLRLSRSTPTTEGLTRDCFRPWRAASSMPDTCRSQSVFRKSSAAV